MPRTISIPVTLYTSQAALTLKAQPIDSAGTAVGAEIATGFAPASGSASRIWTGTVPDGAVGIAWLNAADSVELYRDTLPAAQPSEVVVSTTVYGEDGAIEFTYTVYDVDGTTPLPGVEVRVSADALGTVKSVPRVTDSLGRVIFNLDAGTVYFWRQHPTRTFTDPDSEVVS